MSQDEQATPTPRTDSTIGADKFVPAWKVRKDMGQLERELAAAKAEAERLREALTVHLSHYDASGYRICTEEFMREVVKESRAALAATRKEGGNA